MTRIENCNMTGVKINFDEDGIGVLETAAEALLENAKALSRMMEIFTGSSIKIDALMKINPDVTMEKA